MDGNKKIIWIVFAGIVAIAIAACKVQPPGYVSLYLDNVISVNDTIEPGEKPLDIVDSAMAHVVNTTDDIEAEMPVFSRPAEEAFNLSSDRVYQHEVEKLLKAVTDTIYVLRRQMGELQQQLMVMPDTSFTVKILQENQPLGNQQTDHLTLQQLRAKDEQIHMLQNQLNAMQSAAVTTPQVTHINMEPAQNQPLGNQQTDNLTMQLLQEKNDTIQILLSQLKNLQIHEPQKDTIIKEKEVKEMQPANELVTDQKASDLKSFQDTIRLLKTHMLTLEEQISAGKDTSGLPQQDVKDIPYPTKTDTTLLVAYYELGVGKPLEEESILQQINELCTTKNVTKITLSGYTDSSGSEIVNKELTTLRLNYLLEKIIPWIAKEKVYSQNFGDTFASDKVVNNERRIEIRIHTK